MTIKTNYDLDTKDGMANAIAWTEKTLSTLRNGGAWLVPRSSTIVRLVSFEEKRVKLISPLVPDEPVMRVLKAAGWTIDVAQH